MTSRATRAARAGLPAAHETTASVTPIYQTTAFDVDSLDQLEAISSSRIHGHIYTRDSNPNHDALAADIAALEGAADGVVFASGMGGLSATLLSRLKTRDHLIAAAGLYGRTVQLIEHLRDSYGIEVTFVDVTDPQQFADAVRPETRLCLVESVSNPMLEVADLPAIREALGSVPLMVDSTFTTPSLLRPLEHGANLVFHSVSKYLNGHGDVMMGAVVGESDDMAAVRHIVSLYGMNANPFDCWLSSRGLRTLELRMRQHCSNAQQLAAALMRTRGVKHVYYPGLTTHGSHSVARRLLPDGFGGMLSFELAGGRSAVNQFIQELAHIPFSPTLADVRTTVSYPAETSHKFISADERMRLGITDGIVRVSVGLEAVDDLIAEFTSAIGASQT